MKKTRTQAKRTLSIILALLMAVLIVPVAEATNIPADAMEFNSHYYKAFDESMSWTDAKAYCESLGGHLVTITSAEEQAFVYSVIQDKTKNVYWLGGVEWITGETWSYENWSLAEEPGDTTKPDNVEGNEYYSMMYRIRAWHNNAGTWNDDPNTGAMNNEDFYSLLNHGLVCEWENIYNRGEETYSFENYGDEHDESGHCFGMSMTSAGYYNGLLDINILGSSTKLYDYDDNDTVRAPICYYHQRQGSRAKKAMVAGGFYYTRGFWNTVLDNKYDIASDWEEVVNYVRSHEYDGQGTLQICFRKDGEGGHAINFLRYEIVDGQDRIYAYDNNCPNREVYFEMDENGDVFERRYSTFSGTIDCIGLRDVATYFRVAGDFDMSRVIYAADSAIAVEGATAYPMDGNIELGEHVMFELPGDLTEVKITPLVENASFTYMDQTYTFGKIDEDTYGILTLSATEDGTGTLTIENAPTTPDQPDQPDQPDTPTEPEDLCPWCGGEHIGFFQGIIGWFHGILARIFGARY